MSTKSPQTHSNQNEWDDIFEIPNEKERIRHETQILRFRFLSEIEKYQELQDITRKKLSEKINTSASYLTQVFRGDKPLNFETVAKIQAALNITFHIQARPSCDEMVVNEKIFLESIQCRFRTGEGAWSWRNLNKVGVIQGDIYTGEDKNFINNYLNSYDDKAIPA